MMSEILKKNKQTSIMFVVFFLFIFLFFTFGLPFIFRSHYKKDNTANVISATSTSEEIVKTPSYIETPKNVRGIYMTSWVASDSGLRSKLVNLIDKTELNSIVIDIKDYSGKIVYTVSDPKLKSFGSEEVRVRDLPEFIETLHKKNIYVIGRVAVFQDAYFVKHRPDLAVKTKDGSQVWKDRKGISWIDAGSREYWDYIILIAKESHKIGFDEINFDYIRFPSDGDMKNISFPFSSTTPKSVVLKNFFSYLHKNLQGTGLKTSADLFGMTTTETSDMGIGQIIENALPYFDYVSPMVYPSHYPLAFEGFDDPEKHPYGLIKLVMKTAIDRRDTLASTTGQTLAEYRPWLQDFGLRVAYGSKEVRDQINASEELGLNSWLLWSASNKYSESALQTN